ncbi:hypothetical protein B9Z19DRAFT_1130378 [Tuber borchii]|uniref:Uncharacterized protein n=1 Tax=Tuber borchii TaxID=42251 RepID=A0A2T6ZKS7_TUBBO|nr:hypothetical protein B9Z19DRAFT_1130378 [Tuber borchii]
MKFPPSPRTHSPLGVVSQDRNKGKLDGKGDFHDAWNSSVERVQDGALIELDWPGRNGLLHGKRQVSPTTGMKLMHLEENLVAIELNNSAGHESHDSSSNIGQAACLPRF